MPIFEYYCSDCDSRFEQLVMSRNEAEAPACAECGGSAVKKVHSTFAAQNSSKGPGLAARDSEPEGLCNTCGVPGPCSMN